MRINETKYNHEKNKLLSIVIPTFNRINIIKKTLPTVIAQARIHNVNVIVINNGSQDQTAKYLEEVSSRSPDIRIINRKYNIGGDANVILAINEVDTEYVYVLGDDDLIKNNAVEIIIRDINRYKPTWVNYHSDSLSHSRRSKTEVMSDHEIFLLRIGSWNELIYISNNIYKTEIIGKGINFGLFYQITQSAHALAMLNGIENTKEPLSYIYSCDSIIETDSLAAETGQVNYSVIPFMSTSSLIPELVNKKSQHVLSKIIRNTARRWLTLENIYKIFAIHFHVKKRNTLHSEFLILNIIKTYGARSLLILFTVCLAKVTGGVAYRFAKRKRNG